MFWFIIGIFVGSTLGVFCFALVIGGNRKDTEHVEVEKVQTAKWERKEEGQYYYTACSKCGEHAPYNAYGRVDLTKYCPYCGTLMEGKYEIKD